MLSAEAWGTGREDYSSDGTAWPSTSRLNHARPERQRSRQFWKQTYLTMIVDSRLALQWGEML